MNSFFTNYRKENFLHLIVFIWVLLFSIAAISQSVILGFNKSKKGFISRDGMYTVLQNISYRSIVPYIKKTESNRLFLIHKKLKHINIPSESTSFNTTIVKKETIKKGSLRNTPKKVMKMNLKGGGYEDN